MAKEITRCEGRKRPNLEFTVEFILACPFGRNFEGLTAPELYERGMTRL